MRFFKSFYVYFRILSLDVVLGAGLMCYFYAYCLRINPAWTAYMALGIAVWLIYTLDHLWDARKIPHEANTLRHRFHQKNFVVLSIVWLIIALLGAWLALSLLTQAVFWYGLILCALVLGHFLLSLIDGLKNTLFIQKETRTALIYSLGVALAPVSLSLDFSYLMLSLITAQVFLIAWVNLLIISYFEYESDQRDVHISTAIKLGKGKTIKLVNILIVSQIIVGLISFVLFDIYLFLPLFILILMSLTLVLIIEKRSYFKENERYRALSDAIFYLPIILILLEYGRGF